MASVSHTLLSSALGKPISRLGLVHCEPLGTDGLDDVVATALGQLPHVLDQLHGACLLLPHRHQVRRAQLVAHHVRLDLKHHRQSELGQKDAANWTSLSKDSQEIPRSEAWCKR